MARPKPELPSAASIRALADREGRLALRVTPGSRHQGLEIDGNRLYAKVQARPQGGAANAAVLALLADALGAAPSHLELLRGTTGREKLVRIPLAT